MEQNLLEPRNCVAGAYFPQYSHFSKFAFLSSSSEIEIHTSWWSELKQITHNDSPFHYSSSEQTESKHYSLLNLLRSYLGEEAQEREAEAPLIRTPGYWTEQFISPCQYYFAEQAKNSISLISYKAVGEISITALSAVSTHPSSQPSESLETGTVQILLLTTDTGCVRSY